MDLKIYITILNAHFNLMGHTNKIITKSNDNFKQIAPMCALWCINDKYLQQNNLFFWNCVLMTITMIFRRCNACMSNFSKKLNLWYIYNSHFLLTFMYIYQHYSLLFEKMFWDSICVICIQVAQMVEEIRKATTSWRKLAGIKGDGWVRPRDRWCEVVWAKKCRGLTKYIRCTVSMRGKAKKDGERGKDLYQLARQ